jgi:xanthine/uracil permease
MPLSSALPMAGFFAVAVFAFAGIYWLLTSVVTPMRQLRETLPPTVLGAATFSVLLLLFAAIANSFLVNSAASRGTYLAVARAGLWATYVAAAAASVLIGAIFVRRGDRHKAATVTLVGVVTFMVLALPLSEGVSECYANVTLVLRPSC